MLTIVSEYLPAVLDYPNFYSATAGFGSTFGNLSALAATFTDTQNTYSNGNNGSYSTSAIASFLENHDNARFTNSTVDPAVCLRPRKSLETRADTAL